MVERLEELSAIDGSIFARRSPVSAVSIDTLQHELPGGEQNARGIRNDGDNAGLARPGPLALGRSQRGRDAVGASDREAASLAEADLPLFRLGTVRALPRK
jgi:hypothetical protein